MIMALLGIALFGIKGLLIFFLAEIILDSLGDKK